jgi:site-specific DNA-methyltransferase (adenine-specific)
VGELSRPAGRIALGDNLALLPALVPDGAADLVYIDPPFNTGRAQVRRTVRAVRSATGGREGFGGRRYERVAVRSTGFADAHDDYLAFLEPRLREGHRCLARHGSFYLHLDYREVHYVKVLMDRIFGRDCFVNEIVWAYDFGGRPRDRWPAKHDDILFYVKDPKAYRFDREAIARVPYMAPGLVGPEKAARGKLPTDTWWHSIVGTNSREKTGYPTQKPLAILERIVSASSRPDDLVLDYFAGSGTTGEAALGAGRRFLLIDDNPAALAVMARRFAGRGVEFVGYDPEDGRAGARVSSSSPPSRARGRRRSPPARGSSRRGR